MLSFEQPISPKESAVGIQIVIGALIPTVCFNFRDYTLCLPYLLRDFRVRAFNYSRFMTIRYACLVKCESEELGISKAQTSHELWFCVIVSRDTEIAILSPCLVPE
jgi:hypothetical protein